MAFIVRLMKSFRLELLKATLLRTSMGNILLVNRTGIYLIGLIGFALNYLFSDPSFYQHTLEISLRNEQALRELYKKATKSWLPQSSLLKQKVLTHSLFSLFFPFDLRI